MNAEGRLTIMSSRQVIAVAAAHTNLKGSEYPSARGITLMEMPAMLWKGCRVSKRLKLPPFMSSLINWRTPLRNVLRHTPWCCSIFGVLTGYESTWDEDIDVANAITRHVGMYWKDLSSDFPAKFRQCTCWIKKQRHDEIASTGSAQMMFQMLYTTGVYRASPNTEVAFRIYLATNCSGERSFTQLKRIKDVKPVV